MRYTGGKSLTWFQRTKKDETMLHGPISFVQQAFAERILFLYPTAPYSSSGSLSQFSTSSFADSNQVSRSLSLIETGVGVGDVMPVSVATTVARVPVMVGGDVKMEG